MDNINISSKGFTKRKPFIVTESDAKAKWGGVRDGKLFFCGFCGHQFVVGDVARWVYTNDMEGGGGNPFTCQKCDEGDEINRQKWDTLWKEFKTKYRWFYEHYLVHNN